MAHKEITTTRETWEGRGSVTLKKDGDFTVEVGEKYGYGMTVCEGNANDGRQVYQC